MSVGPPKRNLESAARSHYGPALYSGSWGPALPPRPHRPWRGWGAGCNCVLWLYLVCSAAGWRGAAYIILRQRGEAETRQVWLLSLGWAAQGSAVLAGFNRGQSTYPQVDLLHRHIATNSQYKFVGSL